MFDIVFSLTILTLFGWLILLCWLIAAVETRSNGFFKQSRIGQYGKPFNMLKIKTMHNTFTNRSSITAVCASDVTRSGIIFRRYKLDELPQFWHVLTGKMSIVGPRPDVVGYADKLTGDAANILKLKPGITGPASIKYRNEDMLLVQSINPQHLNDNIIWPDKVSINLEYYRNCSFKNDLYYMVRTVF
ncbi:sugar transferase [Rheinheimera baltica]|uniref:Sugar transferase n=1 Tax=Rheinheimera baltica TaxID=67576 RepID=A0ABT9HUZ5_9GAMM|nr:sugar transferase [Rheinheimera baltica]MDP5134947.1 sugar transferase [Rheinheimera baltica]